MSYRALLQIRDFRLMIASQFLSKVGDVFSGLALPILIFSKTGSVASMAFMMVTYWLPDLLLSPFFGSLVDRVNRKRLMICMDLVRAALVALIPWMPIESLYVICFLLACAGQIFDLAKQGTTVQLVGREKLVSAGSLVQNVDLTITMIGPAGAGVMIALLGLVWPFYIDVLTFLLSALLLLQIHLPPISRERKEASAWKEFKLDFKEGIAFVKSSPPVLFSMTLFVFVMMFAMPMNVLFYPLFQGELKMDSWHIGIAMSVFSMSALLGSVLAPRLNLRFNRVHLILFGLFILGAAAALLAKSTNLVVALGFYAVVGLFNGFVNPLNAALRQENVPDELMGRVSGMYFSIVNSLSFLSMVVTGLFGEMVGVRDFYFYAGLGYALTALLGLASPWYRSTRNLYRDKFQQDSTTVGG